MPIIDFQYPAPSPPVGLLKTVCDRVLDLLRLPPDHAWAVWHALPQGNFYRPGWGGESIEGRGSGPIVRIRCKSTYRDDQVEELIALVSRTASEFLGTPLDSIFVLLDRVQPGGLMARGALWKPGAAGMQSVTLRPIGTVHNHRKDLSDDNWGEVISRIELDLTVVPSHCLEGMEEFSHIEVIYQFHCVDESCINLDLRHPRGLKHLPRIGILAQRAKDRPNKIGLSRCELLSRDGGSLTVRALDAIDGSPVLDIKPWMQALAPRQATKEPGWVSEVMACYYTATK